MWVDTTSIHSDNPGWRDMVCSYFHEWLITFMIAVRKTCLAMVLQKTYPLKPAPPPAAPVPIEYPRIVTNNRPMRDVTAEIITLLHRANTPQPRLFVQGGRLVRLRQDEGGQALLEPATDLTLRHRLSQIADVVQVTGDQVWHVVPSLAFLRDILA